MYELPTYIDVNEQSFPIRNKGDYRVVLDCFIALNDADLSEYERVLVTLIIFYEDFNSIDDITKVDEATLHELVKKMYSFFNCNDEESGKQTNYRLVDWEKDSNLICSAINKVACKEVRAVEYCHWFTFMGYYLAVGESAFSTVIGIRHKIVNNKKLEKYEKEFRRDNPQYFNWSRESVDDKRASDEIINNFKTQKE